MKKKFWERFAINDLQKLKKLDSIANRVIYTGGWTLLSAFLLALIFGIVSIIPSCKWKLPFIIAFCLFIFSGVCTFVSIGIHNYVSRCIELKKFKRCKCCSAPSPEIDSLFTLCEKCFENKIEGDIIKVLEIIDEAEKRISASAELRLKEQIHGTREWVSKNLPDTFRLFVQQGILTKLKIYFPQAMPFNPSNFTQYPVNPNLTELNIPSEGLKILKVIIGNKKQN